MLFFSHCLLSLDIIIKTNAEPPPPTSCSQGGELYVWWGWWLFPRVRGFWENVRLFIPRLRFFFLLLFFFLVEISLRKLSPLFRLGSVHSG